MLPCTIKIEPKDVKWQMSSQLGYYVFEVDMQYGKFHPFKKQTDEKSV